MAYRPRRRAGAEVKAFATAFMQGMKLFSDDDRRGGRSRANDPYSDENLAKQDPRLGSPSLFGKIFGGGEEELTGWDRGRAAIAATRDIAIKRGDMPTVQKMNENALILEKKSAIPSYTERGSAPAARTNTPPAAARPAPAPAPANPPTNGTPAPAVNPDAVRGLPVGDNPPTFQRQSMVEEKPPVSTDTITEPAKVENPPVEEAVYRYDPDKDSIFDRGSSAVDYDMGVDLARGGAVPTMYAARGASVTSRTGETGGALNMSEVVNPGARYTGPNEWGTYEGDDEGTPVDPENWPASPDTDPNAPSVEDERSDTTANLNLSRDPEELAKAALPAVADGLQRIQAELKPSGAISAEDPVYREKLQRFARGDGRLSEEEIKELDSVVDPDGKLPPASRSAARIAAIYRFYQDKGEPDTARDIAARILLYDKFAAQTRGAMAAQALKAGDVESGVKLIEDGFNNNNPDAKTARAERDENGLVKVNKDGTITFNIGWDKLTGFQTTEQMRANNQELVQFAQNANQFQMDRLVQSVEAGRRGKGGTGAAAANRAQAAATGEAFLKQVNSVEAAARNVSVARASGDPDAIRAAEENYRTVDAAARNMTGIRSTAEVNSRMVAIDKARDRGISGGGATARASGTGGGTKEERDAAAAEAELKRLYGERVAIEAGLASSRGIQAGGTRARTPGMSEAAAAEIARRSYGTKTPDLYALDAGVGTAAERAREANIGAVAAIGYKGAKDAPTDSGAEKGSVNALAAPYMKALEGEEDAETGKRVGGVLNRGKKDAKGNVDPASKAPPLTDRERQQFTDIFGRLARKNTTLSRESMAETVYDIARPRAQEIMTGERPEIDWKNKTINYKGKSLYVDEASMRDLAAMRGRTVQEFFRNEREAAGAKQGKIVKDIETDLNATEKQIGELSAIVASRLTKPHKSVVEADRRRQETIQQLQSRREQLLKQADIYGIKR